MSKLSDLLIREMRKADLAFAAECTAAEGWPSENLSALEGFFLYDSHGCFISEMNGRPVGTCIATSYGKSGFIGELIVLPEVRGRGVGAKLLNHGIQSLHQRGTEAIYLDGVLKAVDLYERNGFRKVTRSWRFSGYLTGKQDRRVRRMSIDDLDQVRALDRSYFGADRGFFLKRRFQLFPELSFVMTDGDELLGFIQGCSGPGWLSAGPWVVREGVEHLESLLTAIAPQAGDKPIGLGILDANHEAVDLVRSWGFVERADSPWRMVRGSGGDLGASPGCYAVGSAAKG